MKSWFSILCLLGLPHAASAGASSFTDLARQALESAPQITSQERLVRSAHADRYRRYIPANPQIQVSDADDHASQSYGVSLTVPLPGKPFALSKLDRAKELVQSSELKARQHELVRALGQAYFDCAGQSALKKIQEESVHDLNGMSATMKALYESGRAAQAERIGADLQLRQAQADLKIAQDHAAVTCQYLDEFLAQTRLTKSDLDPNAIELPEDIDNSLIDALAPESADVSRALAQSELAQATSSTSGWSMLPDLTFAFNRNHYFAPATSPLSTEWTSTYSVSVSLPLFYPFNEIHDYRRVRAQAESDRAQSQLLLAKARSDESDAGLEYQRSRARLNEIEKVDLGLAEALVESTLAAYRVGKLGFAELLFARKTLSDLRVQTIQLKISVLNSKLKCLRRCEANASTSTSDKEPQHAPNSQS